MGNQNPNIKEEQTTQLPSVHPMISVEKRLFVIQV